MSAPKLSGQAVADIFRALNACRRDAAIRSGKGGETSRKFWREESAKFERAAAEFSKVMGARGWQA